MAGPQSQADGKEWREYRDPHGRAWGCVMDTKCKNGPAPIGPFEYLEHRRRGHPDCVAPYRPPWLPEQQYMAPVKGRYDLMGIDYPRMLSDSRSRHQEYNDLCMEVSAEMNEAWSPGQPVPAKIRRVAGKPPRPIEPIVACMQGNRWVLGQTDTPHPALAAVLRPAQSAGDDFVDDMDFSDGDEDEVGGEVLSPIEKARRAKAEKRERELAGV
jgi:hypothetical protein